MTLGKAAAVFLAVILDRLTQSLGKPRAAFWSMLFRKNEREELATATA